MESHLTDGVPAKPGKRCRRWVSEAMGKQSAIRTPWGAKVSFPSEDKTRDVSREISLRDKSKQVKYMNRDQKLWCRKRVGRCGSWQGLDHFRHPSEGKTTTSLKKQTLANNKIPSHLRNTLKWGVLWNLGNTAAALLDARETLFGAVVSASVL